MSACARTWTEEQDTRAISEGWSIFESDDGVLRLQRIDEPQSIDQSYPVEPPFKSDSEALAYVKQQALLGSELHRKALELHDTVSDTKILSAEQDPFALVVFETNMLSDPFALVRALAECRLTSETPGIACTDNLLDEIIVQCRQLTERKALSYSY
jgi:hypothetical protein